jgi:hypothetical protein
MGYLLSLSKPATANWLDGSEVALLIGGLVLLIGLLGEHFASAGGIWSKRFAVLVTIGCGIEFLADGGVFLFSTHLQSISDAEVVTAENDAKHAQDSAKDANNSSVAASNRAPDASGQAKKAFDRAASAEKEAGENKLEAERLRLRAEDEAAKRIAIEQQLAWRTLTKAQEKVLIAPLPPELAGTKLLVGDVMGDAEGDSYAAEIWGALSKAGWGDSENPAMRGVGNPISLYFPSVPLQGLQIAERDREQPARFLQATLKKAGIDADMLLVPVPDPPPNKPLLVSLAANIPVGTLKLTVGTKPKKKK